VGLINAIMGNRSIELRECTERVLINEIDGLFSLADVRYALNALLNQPGDNVYAIFTAKHYSFAIMRIKEYTYFFNSHSCTPTGRPASGIGFASIIKYTNSDLKEISGNINGNSSLAEFICSTVLKASKNPLQDDRFSLTRLECREVEADPDLSELMHNISFGNSFIMDAGNSSPEQVTEEGDSGLILEVQTEMIETDSNQPNVRDSIKVIMEHDKKNVNKINLSWIEIEIKRL